MGFGTGTKVQTPSVNESHCRSTIDEDEHSGTGKLSTLTTKEVIVGKTSKVIIAVAVIAGLGLMILDGVVGNSQCGDGLYDQTTGECREGR